MGGALTYVANGLTPVLFHQYDAPQAFAKGGLVKDAKRLSKAGRHGDDIMLHLSRDELADLTKILGEPTINPETGLPEYFSFKKLLKILGAVAPIALMASGAGAPIGAALGANAAWAPVVGNALIGGGGGLLTGGKKGALMGGALAGLGTAVAPVVGNMFGGSSDTIFGDGAGSGVGSSISGMFGGGGNGGALNITPGDAEPLSGDAEWMSSHGVAADGTPMAQGNPESPLAAMTQADIASGEVPYATAQHVPGGALAAPAAPVAIGANTPAAALTGAAKPEEGFLSKYKLPLALGAGSLLLGGMGEEPKAATAQAPVTNTAWNAPLKTTAFPRRYKAVNDPLAYYNYGTSPFEQYDDNALTGEDETVTAATGGFLQGGALQSQESGGSGYVSGGTGEDDGRSDTVDAKLSHNEYVIDAETVALLGNGSPEAGAQKLDDLRRAVRAHKGKALAKGKISPDAKDAMAYLSA